MKIRIGNDVKGLEWAIFREILQSGQVVEIPEDFTECYDVELVCFNTKTRTAKVIPEYGIQNGVVLMNIPAKGITVEGPYTALLSYKRADPVLNDGYSTHAVDWETAFEIVPKSAMEDINGQRKTSNLNYALDGKNAYDYWLEYHEGTVADYVNWMQRPAIIAALRVQSYINESQVAIDSISQRVADMEVDVADLLGEPDEIQQFETYMNFPSLGQDTTLYIDMAENKSYRWDPVNLKYFLINEIDIQIINGGE